MGKAIDETGNRYGRLTVICMEGRDYRGRIAFKCLCDCGKNTDVQKAKVIAGDTKSCGCLLIESRKNFGDRVKLPNGEATINQVYGVYKNSAKKRGYEFKLTKQEFVSIIIKPCIYCGDSLTNKLDREDNNGCFEYTGIDRYNNDIGYSKDNCVPCCSVCNRMKTNMNIEDFKNKIIKIINNNMWQRTS